MPPRLARKNAPEKPQRQRAGGGMNDDVDEMKPLRVSEFRSGSPRGRIPVEAFLCAAPGRGVWPRRMPVRGYIAPPVLRRRQRSRVSELH